MSYELLVATSCYHNKRNYLINCTLFKENLDSSVTKCQDLLAYEWEIP